MSWHTNNKRTCSSGHVHREEELLGRLITKGRQLGLDAHAVTKIFHEIIDDSLRSQQLFLQRSRNPESDAATWNIAYQGEEGNFSHLAARKCFAQKEDSCTFTGYPEFEAVIDAVEDGLADYGILPVENTTAGVINEVYDLLLRTKLSIVGEEILQIRLCLLAVDAVPLSRIRRILAQWQAMAQCSRFRRNWRTARRSRFRTRPWRSARERGPGPVPGRHRGRRGRCVHGLKVLERNITDHPENLTRFIVVATKPVTVDPRYRSHVVDRGDRPRGRGAAQSADRAGTARDQHDETGIPASKGSRFEYLFYIDFEGNAAEPRWRKP